MEGERIQASCQINYSFSASFPFQVSSRSSRSSRYQLEYQLDLPEVTIESRVCQICQRHEQKTPDVSKGE
jgi:hypothetical protein